MSELLMECPSLWLITLLRKIFMQLRELEKLTKNRYTQLLAVLNLIFLLSSFLTGYLGQIILALLFFGTIFLIIITFDITKKYKYCYIIIAFISFLSDLTPLLKSIPDQKLFIVVSTLISIYFLGTAAYLIIIKSLFDAKITYEVIKAGICVYFLIGLLFSEVYAAIYYLDPQAFIVQLKEYGNSFDSVYFSFITLTTIGYGDIIPVNRLARVLVTLEGIVGILYPTITIARLVSLRIAQQDNKD